MLLAIFGYWGAGFAGRAGCWPFRSVIAPSACGGASHSAMRSSQSMRRTNQGSCGSARILRQRVPFRLFGRSLALTSAAASGGDSQALKNNLLGDPSTLVVDVYVRPGTTKKDCRCLSILSASPAAASPIPNWSGFREKLPERLDRLIGEQRMPPVEQHFRCGDIGHRGVFGKSSGGYGAITHALRHADIWSAAACHSGDMGFGPCAICPEGKNVAAGKPSNSIILFARYLYCY
jgi:hypothetical protein